ARFAYRRHTPGADRARHHAYRTHGVERSPLEILAGDVFQCLPARPQVDAVADLGIAGHGCNFGIEKVRHETRDGIGSNNSIGIDTDEDFGIANVLQSKVKRLGLAAVRLGENQYPAGSFFGGKRPAGDFQSTILGTVVDDDHAQIGIVGVERALNRAFDDLLLVISGDENRDPGPVIDGEEADRNQAPGHQDVTQEKTDRDARHGGTEKPEADPIQPRGPILVGRERRHDIRFRFAHQLVDGDELKSAGTRAIDNQRKRQHGSFPIAAAIVHENDVAALRIVRLAGWQVVEYARGDLFWRERRLVVPVPGIDLVADSDVAHALRKFERPHLVFGIWLRIDGVRRTKQHGANAQAAGEQALSQVQFHLHVAAANRADV